MRWNTTWCTTLEHHKLKTCQGIKQRRPMSNVIWATSKKPTPLSYVFSWASRLGYMLLINQILLFFEIKKKCHQNLFSIFILFSSDLIIVLFCSWKSQYIIISIQKIDKNNQNQWTKLTCTLMWEYEPN